MGSIKDEDAKPAYPSDEKGASAPAYGSAEIDTADGIIIENIDGLQRHLGARQIQMVAIGGSIGTALFVSIGSGLIEGGPGSLLIAFILYCVFLATVNNCMAEMAVFMPVTGSFVRMGSKWVDEAFGFMLGVWNIFPLLSFQKGFAQ
jgi:amino acid transporter